MITVISGTNRPNSYTAVVSRKYMEILSGKGIECRMLDLGDLPNDFLYTALYDNSGKNEEFNTFGSAIDSSEKFVFVVPEYNGSFPGVLKGFIDGLKYPGSFKNKKAALVGLSAGGLGAVQVLSHLTDIFNYMGMHVMAYKPRLVKIEDYIEGDKLINEKYIKMLEQQADQIISF